MSRLNGTASFLSTERQFALSGTNPTHKAHCSLHHKSSWNNYVPLNSNCRNSRSKPINYNPVNTARTIQPALQESDVKPPTKIFTKIQCTKPVTAKITDCERKHIQINNKTSTEIDTLYEGKPNCTYSSKPPLRNPFYIGSTNTNLLKDSAYISQNKSKIIKAEKDYKSGIQGITNAIYTRQAEEVEWQHKKHDIPSKVHSTSIIDVNSSAALANSSKKHFRNNSLSKPMDMYPVSGRRTSIALKQSLVTHF